MMGKSGTTDRSGQQKSNDSSDSPTGSGYSTDVSDDNIPCDGVSPSSDINGNSVSDEQVKPYTALICGLYFIFMEQSFFVRLACLLVDILFLLLIYLSS